MLIVDTPGHARHHFCVWDEVSRGFFTGDTFGLAYPELACDGRAFIFPPSTPVQFDPPAWHASIDRLMAMHPERMYLTHFGQLDEPVFYMNDLHRRIDDLAACWHLTMLNLLHELAPSVNAIRINHELAQARQSA